MIVVSVKLVSAISRDRDEDLGTMVLDNVTSRETLEVNKGSRCDYRARMYRKGVLDKAEGNPRAIKGSPTREAFVHGHARHAEPVQNLVTKALLALGYK